MRCKECGDTGEIVLFTSIQPCEACRGLNWFPIEYMTEARFDIIDHAMRTYKNGFISNRGLKKEFEREYPEDDPFDISQETREEMERWKPTFAINWNDQEVKKIIQDINDVIWSRRS